MAQGQFGREVFSASGGEFFPPFRGEAEQISASISVRWELDGIFAYHSYQEALNDAYLIVKLTPNSAEAHGNVGVFLNRLGDYQNALKAARAAMQLNPDYSDAHCAGGYALQGLEDHQAAVGEYQKAIELKPDYVEALVNLGNAYLELDRGCDAVTPLKRAIELMPECLQAHDFLGVAYLKGGDPQGAAEQLEILKGLDSTFEGSLKKLLSTEKPAADDGKRASNGPSRSSAWLTG